MELTLAVGFRISLPSSYFVGDGSGDIEMGINAGGRSVLVMAGYRRGNYEYQREKRSRMPDRVAAKLLEATETILKEPRGRKNAAPGLAVRDEGKRWVSSPSRDL